MLRRYAFSNFQSFLERTEVNLLLNGKVPPLAWEATGADGARVNKAMAVIGPNGSGKTALLKPLAFMAWFLRSSFHAKADGGIPITPHFSASDQPTEMEVEAYDRQGRVLRYVLRATVDRVLHESLHQQKKIGGPFSYVFRRDWIAAEDAYAITQQDFGMAPREARKVRPNASLISTAAQYGVPLALALMNLNLRTNVVSSGRMPFKAENDLPQAAAFFAENVVLRERMVDLLKRWDFGLTSVELKELTSQNPGEDPTKFWFPFGVHADRHGTRRELAFFDESSGTQSAFVLLARLLSVLGQGGIAVIDEFENDLHPHMLEPILDLFAHEATNPYKAQILFTCHAIEVLNVLHKSQVMLVEKDESCESTAWRMDTVKGIRNDDNFYAKYMGGAYGAVPIL